MFLLFKRMLLDVYREFICFCSIPADPLICKRVICMYMPLPRSHTLKPSNNCPFLAVGIFCRPAGLTNTPMDAIAHRPLRLMLLVRMQALARMLLLELAGSAWMEGCQVDGVRVHQLLRGGADVCDEAVQEVQGHAFADDDAEDLGFFFFGGEGVVWTVG